MASFEPYAVNLPIIVGIFPFQSRPTGMPVAGFFVLGDELFDAALSQHRTTDDLIATLLFGAIHRLIGAIQC